MTYEQHNKSKKQDIIQQNPILWNGLDKRNTNQKVASSIDENRRVWSHYKRKIHNTAATDLSCYAYKPIQVLSIVIHKLYEKSLLSHGYHTNSDFVETIRCLLFEMSYALQLLGIHEEMFYSVN